MSTLDSRKNFAIANVSTTYDGSATEIVLASGGGAKFPDPSVQPFNIVWWNATDYDSPADDPNVEIVRVTAKSSNTLTITRAQESTSATTKNTESKVYKVMLAPTAKMFDDIEAAIDGKSALGHTHTLSEITDSGDLAALNTVSTTEIDDDAVTYAKIQNVSATNRLLGRDSAGAGVIEEITPTAVITMLGINNLATASLTPASSLVIGDGLGGWETVTPANFISDNNILDTADIGSSVQAYSSVLQNTTASFLTAQETKLGYITVSQDVDLDTIEARVNQLDAAVVLKGSWDASVGTFPGGGTAQAGDSYIVSVGGTVDGEDFNANDRIIAITDNASTATYASNWLKLDYTDEVLSVAGKTGAVVLAAGDIASGTFADARIAESNVTQHEGAIDHDALTGYVANEHIDWTQDQGATNIDVGNITEAAVTQHQAALSITESQISDLQSYLVNIVEDTTPQLGGNLDVNGNSIVSVSNGDIAVVPHGTGDFHVNAIDLFVDTSEGYVGIGTAAPLKTLQVGLNTAGDATESSVLFAGVANSSTPKTILELSRPRSAGVAFEGGAGFNIKNWNSIVANDKVTQLDITLRDTTSDDLETIAPVISFQSGGNVGIGTTSPQSELHIFKEATTGTSPLTLLTLQVSDEGADTDIGEGPAIDFLVADSTGTSAIGNSNVAGQIAVVRTSATDGSGNGEMVFSTAANASSLVEAMRITYDSLVGIGVAAPLATLHVSSGDSGNVTINGNADDLIVENSANTGLTILGGTDSTGSVYFGDPDNAIVGRITYDHSTNAMAFFTGNAERVRITSSGNFGVGTTAPGAKLTSNITSEGELIRLTVNESRRLSISSATSGSHAEIWSGNNVDLRLGVNADPDALVIKNGGYVGIGTTSPDTQFHVELDSAATNTATNVARLTSTSSGTPANGIGVGVEFEVETTAGNEVGGFLQVITSDVSSGSEDFYMDFGLMEAGAAAAKKMRLTSVGNLGIGDLTVAQINNELVLYSDSTNFATVSLRNQVTGAAAGSGIDFYISSSNFVIYNWEATGEVSFYTNGGERFTVEADGDIWFNNNAVIKQAGTIQANVGASGAGNLAYSFETDTDTGFYRSAANEVRFQTAGADRLTIDANGNIGIGLTAPDVRLDVNGALGLRELSSDPSDPDEGALAIWQSDGTGAGDDGDVMVKVTAGAVTKTITLVDFSAA